jgi:hypothetical protein
MTNDLNRIPNRWSVPTNINQMRFDLTSSKGVRLSVAAYLQAITVLRTQITLHPIELRENPPLLDWPYRIGMFDQHSDQAVAMFEQLFHKDAAIAPTER